MTLVDLAAVWGAVVATAVGLKDIVKAVRDRASVEVSVGFAFTALGSEEAAYGTVIETEHGRQEAVVNVVIINRGAKPTQIVSVFVGDGEDVLHQITSERLPVVVDPGCRVETRIQKEWLDDPSTVKLGVLDGLGRRHAPPLGQVRDLIKHSRELPTARARYRHREDATAADVWAWQVRDRASLTTRRRSTASNE
ncbi:hypothetical protein [Sphingomonas sp. GC_Shp_3]|uniref:hypothetical protein n=1 Tax=Sphingomonas sp. GC_Shp_3 TaxID=2937383 RepID=UPI00226A59BE|nr:hypothetical protein [Sphingomonas sp. GC_Shp_3]